MQVVASLDILLGAKTQGFEKGMEGAAGKVKGFAASVESMAKGGIGGMMASFAGGAAVMGIVNAAKAVAGLGMSLVNLPLDQMAAIDDQVKLADRLGITNEELAGLRVAGELAGGGIEAMTGPLEKMGVLISSAADGNEKAIQTFNDLGLSFEQLHAIGPVQALQAVGKEINKIDNEFDRNRAAKSIFGKSFASAKLAIREISENFGQNVQMATRLGLVLSPQDAKAVTDAKDATEIMGMAWEGLKNVITIELAPTIKSMAESFVELIVAIKDVSNFVSAAKPATLAKQYLGVDTERGPMGKSNWMDWLNPVAQGMKFSTNLGSGLWKKMFGGADGAVPEMVKGREKDKLAGAANAISQASREAPKLAEAGSKEAFEIIAAQQMSNPVVAGVKAVEDKMTALLELGWKQYEIWKKESDAMAAAL